MTNAANFNDYSGDEVFGRDNRILYVEDDPDSRELIVMLLKSEGYDVTAVEQSADVIPLARNERFDLFLLDNWMPELTGVELCRLIRSFDQKTPIFFCSGAVTEADKKDGLSAGAQGYFAKPFDPDDLIQTLRSAVSNPSIEASGAVI